ncbi:D-alanyl-D-alanine carboxypeptidase family protein [Oceanivirga salmonicida]|uniref:D-alanyl-D-alanine carboxypeptidase family protein n=1 Tax=Oceanivirga salmonicida TaxID=1769291 RepID=UPI0012E1E888|nr:serine hydrolase [Oceanivirga salmonicida]
MKKYIIISLLFSFISFSSLECKVDEINNENYTEELSYLKIKDEKIYKSYLLADDKGEILIQDNIYDVLPIASLTKIMTAMVVLDNIENLNEKVKVDKYESKIPYGVRLKENSKYTIYELLNFMLIKSSNSSAQVLADSVSNDFPELMNKKAQEIGATSAHFCTPHGLPPKYTNTCVDEASASDIYLISKYAIENYPLIAEITSTKHKNIANKNLENTNDLLGDYPGIVGIKTGFHNLAGYNISILYENNDKKLYEVILGSDSSEYRSLISTTVLSKFGGNE